MATPNHDFESPEQCSGNPSLFEVTEPPYTGGFLLPDWLKHDTKVVDVVPYAPDHKSEAGITSFNTYVMSDGTHYRMAEGTPFNQRTEIPVDSTTAWWTQPRGPKAKGHNGVTDEDLMMLGFRTRRLGPERFPIDMGMNPFSIVRSVARNIERGFDINLGYTAHNMLEILDTSDHRTSGAITRGVSFNTGESRGAMVEPALQVLSRVRPNGRFFAHSDSTDPMCANPLDLSKPKKTSMLILTELEAIGRTALNVLSTGHPEDYKQTVDLCPESLIPTILALPGLVNGQAGELAKIRPNDASKMHLTFMRRSYGNDHEVFKEIYHTDDHPNVHIHLRGGGHLDIPRVRRGLLRRHSRILDQLEMHGDDPTMIDFDYVYQLPNRPPSKWKLGNLSEAA